MDMNQGYKDFCSMISERGYKFILVKMNRYSSKVFKLLYNKKNKDKIYDN